MADERLTRTPDSISTEDGFSGGRRWTNRIIDPLGLVLDGSGPRKQHHLGGSQEERRRIAEEQARGIQDGRLAAEQGRQTQQQGVSVLNDVASAGRNVGQLGTNALGDSRRAQQGQIGQLLGFAGQRGPSEAEALMQSSLGQAARNNLAIANSGRGPGQAAALAQAQRANAAQGADTSGQLAALRAREAQAQLQRELQARQTALGAQGQISQQALGQMGAGLQAQGMAGSGIGSIGGQAAQTGVTQQVGGMQAQNASNVAQLNADMGFAASGAQADAANRSQNSSIIGGLIGALI